MDLPKNSIIFNHKQTESLLKNGYVASRGKAYAEGNAHVTFYPNKASKEQWEGTGYDGPDDTTWDASAKNLASAFDDASDKVGEFADTLDFIEIRMEELDERLGLYDAHLENATTYGAKNNIVDEMIKINKDIAANSKAGAEYYNNKANEYLSGMSDELVNAAKNGAIAIEEFEKEQDEATVEAIKNYRTYSQKATELTKKSVETIAAIRDLAIKKIDNIQDYGSAKTGIEDAQTEKLQNRVDLDEARGLITSSEYYTAMMENSGKKIEYWTPVLSDMRKEFKEAVSNGSIVTGSIEWYEQLAKIYEVQSEIDSATIELEEFQNSINDIYWSNFDQLINRIGYLRDETQSLIDLMADEDMVITPETDDGWTADQVEWTKEGLASLGLYAQQMEMAEYDSRQYAQAIDDLTKEYDAGKYSENEYLEKLNELQSAQYGSIKAYQDAEKAIVDLNKTRVDEIKNGIDKQVDAYQKLIEKKKEALNTEKDLYDFQKSAAEQSKNIADIERKLAALANDTSMSAMAKKRQLEAELAEAKSEQEDLYYNRSIDQQQTVLDNELDTFTKQKEAEKEKWDEYLENIETVVAESLGIVQANAAEIGQTLTDKASEYNLTVSDAILSPWEDGALAVSGYQTSFDTAMSSTTAQLDTLKGKWQEVINKMAEAGAMDVYGINLENESYAPVGRQNTSQQATTPKNETPKAETSKEDPKPSLAVGSYVEVKPGTKWYSDSYGGGASGNARSGKIKYINSSGSHAYNIEGLGWVKKTDIKGYAKGTTGVDKDQLALIDELGDELVFHATNGKLAFLTKGSSVIPHDISENLMKLGSLDPTDVLGRNTPKIGIHPSVHNTEINLNITYGDMVSIGEFHGDNPEDIAKIVAKQFDKHTKDLNNALRKFVR